MCLAQGPQRSDAGDSAERSGSEVECGLGIKGSLDRDSPEAQCCLLESSATGSTLEDMKMFLHD